MRLTFRSCNATSSLLVFIAAVAIFVGAFARLYDLDRMLVWHDEAFSLMRTFGFDQGRVNREVFEGRDLRAQDLLVYQRPSPSVGFGQTMASLMTHPEHSPLFYLAARVATPVFESPIAGLRGTSAMLSLFLIPAMFWLARELFEDSAAAWIAAALAACSPLYLLYAQEARQYALWSFLTAAASAALLRAVRKGQVSDWALYGILIALALYTHLLSALVLAAHGAYVLLSFDLRRSEARTLLRGWGSSVAAAVLLFSPWIAVVMTRAGQVHKVTAWMERPVPLQSLFEAWGNNLVHLFVDLPLSNSLLLLGLIPLAWVLWRFSVHAPRAARLFIGILFLASVAVTLVPDLVQGGSRSHQARYALPGFVALQLAVAYVLATGWHASANAGKMVSRTGLLMVLGLGCWSGWLILQADSWWSKNFSLSNREVATLMNSTERPLLLVSQSGISLGDVISLAHDLDERVVIRGQSRNGADVAVTGFSDIFLLTPSAELRTALSSDYDFVPLFDTWQWYRAVPKSNGSAACVRQHPSVGNGSESDQCST